MRKFVGGILALVLCVGFIQADELKGKIKSMDSGKNTLTLTVADKDRDLVFNDETKLLSPKGKDVKDRAKALKALKEGAPVTVVFENKNGKDVATSVMFTGQRKKKGGQ